MSERPIMTDSAVLSDEVATDVEPDVSIENIRPKEDRVFIKPLVVAKTKGGILMPGTTFAPKRFGKVVAVGPGRRDEQGNLIPMTTKVGDTVLLGQYPGQDFKFGEIEYLMLHDREIVAGIE
jgi:chaperonin GroES